MAEGSATQIEGPIRGVALDGSACIHAWQVLSSRQSRGEEGSIARLFAWPDTISIPERSIEHHTFRVRQSWHWYARH